MVKTDSLPPVVSKSLICIRHAVHVLFLFYSSAAAVRSVHDFLSELIGHRLARTRPRVQHQPMNGERLLPEGVHFHRYLVVRSAYPPRLYLQHRLAVLDGLLEQLERVVVRFLGHLIHRAVKNRLRGRALAVVHHARNKLLHEVAPVHRIARNLAPKNPSFSWHLSLLLLLRRFGPFRAIFGARLLAIIHASRIERSANHVITHSRQVLHASATNEHDRVFLQVVPNSRNVRGHFSVIRQPCARHFSECRVRLLRRLRINADAHSSLLRTSIESRRLGLRSDLFAAATHQL